MSKTKAWVIVAFMIFAWGYNATHPTVESDAKKETVNKELVQPTPDTHEKPPVE